ncbi:hypothetical protein PHYBLDRAFT_71280 [Phycomyces blakesleeanus NRRL 1555(-)]|uniref:Uncharacterized protein n=1 Tax=Phycomyces blakesleeanus (strain ATCC 8743b / DSM 1359 / FGSC 10004 / NBRC 33097 / NRRL 1555) TaxID=763407 RepID=A0A162TZ04_PHYB8|nr:hypothetical protein PHYBLDRAFT_71280 [Phycomyces blakesleeanus NRRL 1555(-)]OAD72132.1 hypothetical protein PHYBLDRAFT_71280 [Phycomyces blakesleeanus NRRL 1555(-)]|eukprot:XP_018290172.1 hypothetical protein PHYBLDRAFT_71280 [Phycomyces blakesleeanus NRRL 1555(-)]
MYVLGMGLVDIIVSLTIDRALVTSCGISECIYCLTSVGVTIMTSSHKLALGLPTKLAPYRSDTVYPAMIATTLSQYEYVLICDKSNIRVSGSPHFSIGFTKAFCTTDQSYLCTKRLFFIGGPKMLVDKLVCASICEERLGCIHCTYTPWRQTSKTTRIFAIGHLKSLLKWCKLPEFQGSMLFESEKIGYFD